MVLLCVAMKREGNRRPAVRKTPVNESLFGGIAAAVVGIVAGARIVARSGRATLRVHTLVLFCNHLIEFLFLIVIQRGADFADGGFAQRMNLLHLLIARGGAVAHDAHGLLVLVEQDRPG